MKKTILVAEDQADQLYLYTQILKRGGFDTLSAKDGTEALKLIREGAKPDAILTDINLCDLLAKTGCRVPEAVDRCRFRSTGLEKIEWLF